MATSTVHSSQRRISCDICRRQKTRCIRIAPDDAKCARCTMLGEECKVGREKRIGRPRRLGPAPSRQTGNGTTREPRVKPVRSPRKQRTTEDLQGNFCLSGSSPGLDFLLGMDDQHYLQDVMFSTATALPTTLPTSASSSMPATNPKTVPQTIPPPDTASLPPSTSFTASPPLLGTPTNALLVVEPPWPTTTTAEIQSLSHSPRVPWKVLSCFKHSSAFADHDWNIIDNDESKTKSSRLALTVICSDPDSLIIPELGAPMGHIDLSAASFQLSRLRGDLNIRIAAIESHRPVVMLDKILFREGPLFINDLTLGEFIMRSAQELFHLLSRLLNNRQCRVQIDNVHNKLDTVNPLGLSGSSLPLDPFGGGYYSYNPAFPSASPQPLLGPLASTIIAVYTKLVYLYEFVLRHIIQWLENIGTGPPRPFSGLQVGEAWLQDLSAQGIRFANASLNFLGRIERTLGLSGSHEWEGPGLLSVRQIQQLWSVLDGMNNTTPGYGSMRPAYLKTSLRRALSILTAIGDAGSVPPSFFP